MSAPVLISGGEAGDPEFNDPLLPHLLDAIARCGEVAALSCVSPLFAKAGWCCCAVPCTRRWREEHGFG